MGFEFNGTTIETNAGGFLENREDWSEDLAKAMAAAEDIELTDRHWDVIKFLREEFFENRENQPNTRTIVKAMSSEWGEKIKQGDLYELFPLDPSKQGGRIAGLPESRRKGGY
ncbi:TusE/DsrC/DsvC family sulfur relay protein [Alisedimentitalea sp. MJ-SS2]|uniref:TusE/DsrC/DsvC family sulfur relay protein n=1 Tax=Aliisedimentitalea sp. MJ-SS2 TaxID=3049795 RepID=UPI002910314C|nr:TusE/DsrC/DsvC family sulfur relay protein [Alisedimentitalea sp. MJ-SS2]MDU8928253.1 TusE/DsrC/DsvC family sulfur relay protein [Alisedimentitalea sp. MJ-SS2]